MEELIERIVRMEAELSTVNYRMEHLEKFDDDLTKIIVETAKLDDSVNDLRQDMAEIKSDLKNISSKPGDRWEKIIASVIAAVTTGLIAALLTRFI